MKTLFYPSAGNNDWKIAFEQFKNSIDKFIFVDINYNLNNIEEFTKYFLSVGNIEQKNINGDFNTKVKIFHMNNKTFRDIEPAYYSLDISFNGIKKQIIFRKGFGQYALNELDDDSLDIFYHRGDSKGEGGSNVFYLGNRNATHPPLRELFNKLKDKLKNDSLIVSDGSNTDSKSLKKIYRKISTLNKDEAKNIAIGKRINLYNIEIECIDILDFRYNHTLIWKVRKV